MIADLIGLVLFFIELGVSLAIVYSILNYFYPNSSRKLKIEASIFLGFIALGVFMLFVSFNFLLVFLLIGLGVMYGLKKAKS
ncbi:hypothetical protein [Sulfurisphaera ohwakuensis]|uniref:Putative membrane channel-forming protein YqfA (Hemolysin III family) n=1 Tax=Sulfurisphaera ohwakuensis TaxID=69656 RepID=A0A650CD71_SULOH|nr:hypothetical protein [Sulfurisphaera ohwakuensis]MBB5255180.1 putative membrane channel-forming protein YqfA (hemolysin III family) [Sulfurisphaera ohwakuensis]QGR15780.1 hypothetical protein D1869_00110 [Sulfurisphaera ohwakuensis]